MAAGGMSEVPSGFTMVDMVSVSSGTQKVSSLEAAMKSRVETVDDSGAKYTFRHSWIFAPRVTSPRARMLFICDSTSNEFLNGLEGRQ